MRAQDERDPAAEGLSVLQRQLAFARKNPFAQQEESTLEQLEVLRRNRFIIEQGIDRLSTLRVDGISSTTMQRIAELTRMFAVEFPALAINYRDLNGSMDGFTEDPETKSYAKRLKQVSDSIAAVMTPDKWKNFQWRIAEVTRPVNARGWRCKYTGTLHKQPRDCQQPQLGGHWE